MHEQLPVLRHLPEILHHRRRVLLGRRDHVEQPGDVAAVPVLSLQRRREGARLDLFADFGVDFVRHLRPDGDARRRRLGSALLATQFQLAGTLLKM